MSHNPRYMGYHGPMNHANLADEEESHRAPSDRTMSEYIVSADHTTVAKEARKNHPRKYEKEEERRSKNMHDSQGSVLSGASRPSLHPLSKSASHGSICDNGSDIYITSAAYRATSDIRILGIVFLIFGFLTLIGSLIYCVHVFRNAKHPHDINPEDLYWTRYWQGHVGSVPEVYYKAEDKYQDDGYSDRLSKYSGKYYDRHSQRY